MCPGRLVGTTVRLEPSWWARRYPASPMPPTAAAAPTPTLTSARQRSVRNPNDESGSLE